MLLTVNLKKAIVSYSMHKDEHTIELFTSRHIKKHFNVAQYIILFIYFISCFAIIRIYMLCSKLA